MRFGLDLRGVEGTAKRLSLAIEADRLGLWAVLIGGDRNDGPPDAVTAEAAAMASATRDLHLALWLDAGLDHPLALAEEIAVVDQLSERRTVAVIAGPRESVDHIDRLLGGHIVDGVILAPPPAQTRVPVWAADETRTVSLTGDLVADRITIDVIRDGGCSHLFVEGPGPVPELARHLAGRAASVDFPEIVADMADRIAPL